MKKRLLSLTLIVFFSVFTYCQIINIPADYASIQQGIEAANTADTVLVSPGTYVENINFSGKNITLASHYLITNDTSYISQTIIDGSQPLHADSASVIRFCSGEDSTALLSGFTIINGSGTRFALGWSWSIYGGGIYITNANPTIKNVCVKDNTANAGAGIYCGFSSSPDISYSKVISNMAFEDGGGIYCSGWESNLKLANVSVLHNSAINNGGGILYTGDNNSFSNLTITENTAKAGGGVYFYSSDAIFDSINRTNIYNNYALIGNDLYSETAIEIIIDTFSVILPTEYHAYPIENFEFDILNGKIEQVNADLYVSPEGENSNGGLSANDPLKNIHTAFSKIIADSIEARTVHLAAGTYSSSDNDEFYPLNIPDYVSLVGETESGTILSGDNQKALIRLIGNTGTLISNLTITNGQGGSESTGGSTAPYAWAGGITCHESSGLVIKNITVMDNSSGIYCTGGSSPILDSITIQGNQGRGLYCKWGCNPDVSNSSIIGNSGSGIVCSSSDPNFFNLTISDNSDHGLWCYNSSPVLKNSTISNNSADAGGGIHLYGYSFPSIENVIISNNYASSFGGGIYCMQGATPNLKHVTIKDNSAFSGGGIFCNFSSVSFDTIDRCNVYLNIAVKGNDIYSNTNMDVVVDTFTVISPSVFHAYSLENFSFDILNGKVEQSNNDLFVSPLGSNNNSGLSANEPLKTVHHAFLKIFADSLNPHSIELQDGIYGPSTNEEIFPRLMQDFVSLKGKSEESVILNGEELSKVLMFEDNKGANISDLTVTGGAGGGISILNSNFQLRNITIKNNSGTIGGGISSLSSNLNLINVTLSKNSATISGGGVFLDQSNAVMENVSITENSSDQGGGMYLTGSNIVFSTEDRCNIYLNTNSNNRSLGSDIFAFQNDPVHVVVDTFTVLTPTDYYASDIDLFTFDILNSIYGNLISSDLYISVNGDNSNSGTSPEDPLKTINYAVSRIYSDSLNQRTIHLLPGIYSHSTNGEEFPINLSSYVSLKGSGEEESILDADNLSGVMRFDFVKSSKIEHLTIQNGYAADGAGVYCNQSSPHFENVTIKDNNAFNDGGGVFCHGSSPSFNNITISNNSATNDGGGILCDEASSLISNVIIANNTAGYGGGMCCWDYPSPKLINVNIANNTATGIYGSSGGGLSCKWDTKPELENVIITGNNSSYNGGGISCAYNSNVILKNATIADNHASDHGGGIFLKWGTSANLTNCILWNNSPVEIHFYSGFDPDTITISWSDIEHGMEGIVTNNNGLVNWLEGNILDHPKFVGIGDHPYAIQNNSPCIDTGIPDTTGLFLQPYDLIGNPRIWNDRIDMGAYEWNSIGTNDFNWSNSNIVIVYPNPFSTSTTLSYELQQPERVTLRIYDFLGKQVYQTQENQSQGQQQLIWNAEGYADGVYYYRLQIGDAVVSGKMVKVR